MKNAIPTVITNQSVLYPTIWSIQPQNAAPKPPLPKRPNSIKAEGNSLLSGATSNAIVASGDWMKMYPNP